VTRPLRLTPAALADLTAIGDYIARDNAPRAVTFVRELRAHCRRLAARPRMHRLREELGAGIRGAVHGAYLILYAEEADGSVVVHRVLHGARDLAALADDHD